MRNAASDNFDFTKTNDEGETIKVPKSTLIDIVEKGKVVEENIANTLSSVEGDIFVDLTEALENAAFIVGAANYYLEQEE